MAETDKNEFPTDFLFGGPSAGLLNENAGGVRVALRPPALICGAEKL
jgi:hypothetical protein